MTRLTAAARKMNIAVAEDVLKLLPRLKPRCGMYIGYSTQELVAREYAGKPAALQAAIPKLAKGCEVCAKGAMFLAHVHLYDGVDNFSDVSERVDEVFGDQSKLIEAAFEGWGVCWSASLKREIDTPECVKFCNRYRSARTRLRAIMTNIIRNKGAFQPKLEAAQTAKGVSR